MPVTGQTLDRDDLLVRAGVLVNRSELLDGRGDRLVGLDFVLKREEQGDQRGNRTCLLFRELGAPNQFYRIDLESANLVQSEANLPDRLAADDRHPLVFQHFDRHLRRPP